MSFYLLRRIYQSIIVLFVVTIIVFVVLHSTGDPVQILMPVESTPKQIEEMRHNLGLDKPLWLQYVLFLKNALQGNLGTSFHHGQPAIKLVLERVPATLELVLVAFAMSFVLSIPIGVIAATHRGKAVDRFSGSQPRSSGLASPPYTFSASNCAGCLPLVGDTGPN